MVKQRDDCAALLKNKKVTSGSRYITFRLCLFHLVVVYHQVVDHSHWHFKKSFVVILVLFLFSLAMIYCLCLSFSKMFSCLHGPLTLCSSLLLSTMHVRKFSQLTNQLSAFLVRFACKKKWQIIHRLSSNSHFKGTWLQI